MRENYWKPHRWPLFKKHFPSLSEMSENLWQNCSIKGIFGLIKIGFKKLWNALISCCKKKEKVEDRIPDAFGHHIRSFGGMTLDIEAASESTLLRSDADMPSHTQYTFDSHEPDDSDDENYLSLRKSREDGQGNRSAIASSHMMKHPAITNSHLAQMIQVLTF